MKFLKKSAGVILILLAVMFVTFGLSFADDSGYEVDDLMGENANTLQWMVINDSGNTFGGRFNEAITVSTDLTTDIYGNSKINILSGTPDSTVMTDRNPHLLFFLLSQGFGEFSVNLKLEDSGFDVSTPTPELSTIVEEGATPYYSTRQDMGIPVSEDLDSTWRKFHFNLLRNGAASTQYDTVVQSFNFKQNPNAPSQNLARTTVISNVSPYDARTEPLILRMTLRNAASNGNIVAYDTTTWAVDKDQSAGGDQWVFVPVDDRILNDRQIKYYLTTEVVNHTAARYEALPLDGYGTWQFPDYWKFDLPRYHWTTNVNREFYLSPTSHIAPGLVSVFKRQYNVSEENKRALRVQGVDTANVGLYNMYLDHDIIYGKLLGDTQSIRSSQGNFNLFEVTAFQPNEFSMNFYENVKSVVTADSETAKEIKTPTTKIFNANALKQEDDMPGIGSLTEFFTINQTIPANIRSSSTEGLLPLHITFNIPITLIKDEQWLNDLIDTWNDSGRIENLFAEKYEIVLLTETNGELNPWNLTQELQRKGCYETQVKVFYDEDRGTTTSDNAKGLITVSLIAMLMDGTRDGTRPQLSIATDHAIDADKEYIIIRDGIADNKWNMTFFISEAGYQNNPNLNTNAGTSANTNLGSPTKSSSTCNSNLPGKYLLFVILPIMIMFTFKNRERRF